MNVHISHWWETILQILQSGLCHNGTFFVFSDIFAWPDIFVAHMKEQVRAKMAEGKRKGGKERRRDWDKTNGWVDHWNYQHFSQYFFCSLLTTDSTSIFLCCRISQLLILLFRMNISSSLWRTVSIKDMNSPCSLWCKSVTFSYGLHCMFIDKLGLFFPIASPKKPTACTILPLAPFTPLQSCFECCSTDSPTEPAIKPLYTLCTFVSPWELCWTPAVYHHHREIRETTHCSNLSAQWLSVVYLMVFVLISFATRLLVSGYHLPLVKWQRISWVNRKFNFRYNWKLKYTLIYPRFRLGCIPQVHI